MVRSIDCMAIATRFAVFPILSVALFLYMVKDYYYLNKGSDIIIAETLGIINITSSIALIGQENDFVNDLIQLIHPINNAPSIDQSPLDHSLALIIKNGKLYCRRAMKRKINDDKARHTGVDRMKAIVEMIRTGLNLYEKQNGNNFGGNEALPILLISGDQIGCCVNDDAPNGCIAGIDQLQYPRLTFSIPSSKYDIIYGNGWCKAIGMPTYSNWIEYHEKHKTHSSWKRTFASYSRDYNWEEKSDKAVWRGRTTYPPWYLGAALNETPRGKLVQLSMKNSDLIDAAFVSRNKAAASSVSLSQQYEGKEKELSKQTRIEKFMNFDDQMKYTAILDIDGNNWSSRFPRLLCTNSVVVKIDPDYVEYFYYELKPMEHYVPASLDNLTEVVSYVLDWDNEDDMIEIIDTANAWCKKRLTEEHMAMDMMQQVQLYKAALTDYMDEHKVYDLSMITKSLFSSEQRLHNATAADDLVECN